MPQSRRLWIGNLPASDKKKPRFCTEASDVHSKYKERWSSELGKRYPNVPIYYQGSKSPPFRRAASTYSLSVILGTNAKS